MGLANAATLVYSVNEVETTSTIMAKRTFSTNYQLQFPIQFKISMCCTVPQKFPCCLWNSSNVRLNGPPSSFPGRSSRAFHTSLLQAINGVMSLALCPWLAPQHLDIPRAASHTCGFLCPSSICLVFSLHSRTSRAVHPQEFSEVMLTRHISLGFSFHISFLH